MESFPYLSVISDINLARFSKLAPMIRIEIISMSLDTFGLEKYHTCNDQYRYDLPHIIHLCKKKDIKILSVKGTNKNWCFGVNNWRFFFGVVVYMFINV